MKKIYNFIDEYKFVLIIYFILLILVLPMLNMFRHAVMNADDFLYGKFTYRIWEKTHSVFQVVKEAAKSTFKDYFNWQGSFASVFFMYMQPGIYSTTFYRLFLISIFILFFVSSYLCLMTFNKYLLKGERKTLLCIYGVFMIVATQFMPSAFEAWFWYNGVIYYMFTFCLNMLFVALAVKHPNIKTKWVKFLSVISLFILVILMAGSNYITSVAFILCYLVFIIFAVIKKFSNNRLHTALLILYLMIFLLNVLAPGNFARAQGYTQPVLGLVAVFSLKEFLFAVPHFTGSVVTLAAILISTLFAKDIVKNAEFRFINPLAALIFVIFVLICQYAPTVYGYGHAGPQRCINIRFLSMQISLWALAVNLYGYLYQHKKLEKTNPLVIIIVSAFMIIYSLSLYPATDMWGYKSLDYYIGGQLNMFSDEMNQRIEKFEDKSSDEKLSFENKITNEMLHPDEKLWFNYGIWDYYRKTPKK